VINREEIITKDLKGKVDSLYVESRSVIRSYNGTNRRIVFNCTILSYSLLFLFAYTYPAVASHLSWRTLVSREQDEQAFVSDLKALQRQLCNYYRAGIRRDYSFLPGSCLHSSYFQKRLPLNELLLFLAKLMSSAILIQCWHVYFVHFIERSKLYVLSILFVVYFFRY